MSKFALKIDGDALKLNGVAYDGGKIDLPGWKFPLVIDLAGIIIPDVFPLLFENHEKMVVANAFSTIKDNTLELRGDFGNVGEKSRLFLCALFNAVADWETHIGADVKECELVTKTKEVNGRIFEGKFYHIQKSVLREITILPKKGGVADDGFTLMDWLVIVRALQESTKVYLEEYIKQNSPFSGEAETSGNKLEDMAFILKRNAEVLKKIAPLVIEKERNGR